jgi:hypothetical protein
MSDSIVFSAENYDIYNPVSRFYSAGRNGRIQLMSDGGMASSDSWFIASVQFLSFDGRICKTVSWADFYNMYKNGQITHDELYFKNGRPKTRLTDIDHETPHVWGSRVEF